MKPFACYPRMRTRYHAPAFGFFNPYFPQTTKEEFKKYQVSNRPAANILRTEGAYLIQLAVPGFSKDQVKIELQEDQLIITGSTLPQDTQGKKVREEFDYSGFKRAFRLHKNADTSALTASFDQGILTITVPNLVPENISINIQ